MKHKTKQIFRIIFGFISLGFIAGLIILGAVMIISFDLPEINSLADYSPAIPSKIYSRDGELLLEMGKETREVTAFDEIPPKIVSCFLAAEDDNFYNHTGIDYLGIARAMFKNIKAGRIVQGASTITQQVAKSLLLSSERTFSRKIKDLLLAKKIEEKFTKDEILFLYLNQVYLGGGYYGVKSAFKGYFDKELSEATVAECALVAGLLVAPGRYSPYVNPKYAKKRQRYVLSRLFKTEKITKEEYEAALAEDIRMKLRTAKKMKAGYFTDWVKQRVIKKIGVDAFLTGGFEVVSTINWPLQKKAEKEVLEGAKKIDKRQGYKGALGSLETEEERLEFLEKERQKMYKEKSNFFTFFTDGTTKNEFIFNEDEIKTIFESDENKKDEYKLSSRFKKHVVIGQNLDDPFMDFISVGDNLKGIVTHISDLQRMIYVNFAGLKGMISYDNFKWAHERTIKEERNYYGHVTRPSSILKVGDIVNVKVLGKPTNPWKYIWSSWKKRFKDKKLSKAIESQKYYDLLLDQEPEVQAALLSVNAKTGDIVSLVGGTDFDKSQFNRVVQSNRQPGSAFKPLLFAVGLENNYTPSSILLDSPQALDTGSDISLQWKPRNYDGKFKGEMTFRRALETSRNIPTIRLVQNLGVNKILDFTERLKLGLDLPKDLSVSLGSFGINLLNLVKTYAIFPNGGRKATLNSIVSIKDRFGKVYHLDDSENWAKEKDIEAAEQQLLTSNEEVDSNQNEEVDSSVKQNPYLVNLSEEQVYDPRLAYIMTNLLKGVVQYGTGMRAKDLGSSIGGKTGTTNNYVDAWFLGFSSTLVTGVWTGFDNNKTLGWGETGAKSALPIWRSYMRAGLAEYPESDFTPPAGIINVAVDKATGKPVKSAEKQSFIESFVEGTEPKSFGDYEEKEVPDSPDKIIEDDDYFSEE